MPEKLPRQVEKLAHRLARWHVSYAVTQVRWYVDHDDTHHTRFSKLIRAIIEPF